MKYRSISLNSKSDIGLVKYNEKYQEEYSYYFDVNDGHNILMTDDIKNGEQLFKEKLIQNYMLCYRYNIIGGVNIDTSKKDLEVFLHLNPNRLEGPNKTAQIVNDLVNSLKLYFYDKENIILNVLNEEYLELDSVSKILNNDDTYTYIFKNTYNNFLMPALVEEVTTCEKNLTNWGEGWLQHLDMTKNLSKTYDTLLSESIQEGKVTYPELFSKFDKIIWQDINSNKATRNIIFRSNGDISYSKHNYKTRNMKKHKKCTIDYNVLGNSFSLIEKTAQDNFEIEHNPIFTEIRNNNLNMVINPRRKRSKINYTSDIVNNSSVAIELWCIEGKIINCYIDFRTHRNYKNKINGSYTLRIAPEKKYGQFSLKFVSRKGSYGYDFSEKVAKEDEELYSTLLYDNINLDLIEELINKLIPVINKEAAHNNKPLISLDNTISIQAIKTLENRVLDLLNEIKDGVPLNHLENILQTFTTYYEQERPKQKILK